MAKQRTVKAEEQKIETAPDLENYRKCPLCYGTRGSIGRANGRNAATSTDYFVCPSCGHTWSAVVKKIVQSVDLNLEKHNSEKLLD